MEELLNGDDLIEAQLIRASECLPVSDQFKVIRCNIVSKWLDKQTVGYNSFHKRCYSCGINFENVPYKVYYQPAKKSNRFLRRLLKNESDPTTKFQMSSLNNIKLLRSTRYMIITCSNCKKQSKQFIKAPQRFKSSDDKQELPVVNKTKNKINKRKRMGFQEVVKDHTARMRNNIRRLSKFLKPKVDSNVILLDSPKTSKSKSESGSQNKLNSDDSVICLENTEIKNNVNLPLTSQQTQNSSVVDLVTLVKKNNVNLPLTTQQIQNSSVVDLVTPVNFVSSANKSVTVKKNEKKFKRVHQRRLAMKASKKSKKKLNALSQFLNDNCESEPKMSSNLENFLKSFS